MNTIEKKLEKLDAIQAQIERVAKLLDKKSDGYKYLMDACDALMDAQMSIDMEATLHE